MRKFSIGLIVALVFAVLGFGFIAKHNERLARNAQERAMLMHDHRAPQLTIAAPSQFDSKSVSSTRPSVPVQASIVSVAEPDEVVFTEPGAPKWVSQHPAPYNVESIRIADSGRKSVQTATAVAQASTQNAEIAPVEAVPAQNDPFRAEPSPKPASSLTASEQSVKVAAPWYANSSAASKAIGSAAEREQELKGESRRIAKLVDAAARLNDAGMNDVGSEVTKRIEGMQRDLERRRLEMNPQLAQAPTIDDQAKPAELQANTSDPQATLSQLVREVQMLRSEVTRLRAEIRGQRNAGNEKATAPAVVRRWRPVVETRIVDGKPVRVTRMVQEDQPQPQPVNEAIPAYSAPQQPQSYSAAEQPESDAVPSSGLIVFPAQTDPNKPNAPATEQQIFAIPDGQAVIPTPKRPMTPDDQKIAEKAAGILSARGLAKFHVDIEYQNGMMTVAGKVGNAQQRALVTRLLSDMPEVKQVKNDLTVDKSPSAMNSSGADAGFNQPSYSVSGAVPTQAPSPPPEAQNPVSGFFGRFFGSSQESPKPVPPQVPVMTTLTPAPVDSPVQVSPTPVPVPFGKVAVDTSDAAPSPVPTQELEIRKPDDATLEKKAAAAPQATLNLVIKSEVDKSQPDAPTKYFLSAVDGEGKLLPDTKVLPLEKWETLFKEAAENCRKAGSTSSKFSVELRVSREIPQRHIQTVLKLAHDNGFRKTRIHLASDESKDSSEK